MNGTVGEDLRSDEPRRGSGAKAEAILAGAMHEFLEHGYAATSMDRVAAVAGVSKATLYAHFGDKEGLFDALSERLAREKLGAVLRQDDPALWEGEPGVVLRRLATGMLDTILGDPQLLAFVRLVVGESGRFPLLARSFVANLDRPLIGALTRYLASRPELGLADPEASARVIFGTIFSFVIIQELLGGKETVPMERDRLVEGLVALVACR